MEDLNGEIWKDIEGYEGSYQISNTGRVKSLSRVLSNQIKKSPTLEIIMKPGVFKGYQQVGLRKGSKGKTFKVHRLVAFAFIENPEAKPYINHLNGVRNDNRVENLEWCTNSENLRHAYRTGIAKTKCGIATGGAKINDESVLIMRKMYYQDGLYLIEISKQFKMSTRNAYKAIVGESWAHVPHYYKNQIGCKAPVKRPEKMIVSTQVAEKLANEPIRPLYYYLQDKHALELMQEIKSLRDDYGINAESVAKRIGVHKRTYQRWITEKNRPDITTLSKIYNAVMGLKKEAAALLLHAG